MTNSYAALFDDDPNEYLYPDTGATVTCVTNDTKLINEKLTTNGMKIGSCSNHILQSTATGRLPINLPQAATTAQKVDGININLLSIGQTCDQKCVGIFKEKEMFIANEDNIEIIMHANPLVIGTRKGEGHNDL